MRLIMPAWSSPVTTNTRDWSSCQERRQSCWLTLTSLLSSALEDSQAARHPPVQSWGKSQSEGELGFSSTARHSSRQSSISSLDTPLHRAWQVAVLRVGFRSVFSNELEVETEVAVEEVGVMMTARRKTVEMVAIILLSRWWLVID